MRTVQCCISIEEIEGILLIKSSLCMVITTGYLWSEAEKIFIYALYVNSCLNLIKQIVNFNDFFSHSERVYCLLVSVFELSLSGRCSKGMSRSALSVCV